MARPQRRGRRSSMARIFGSIGLALSGGWTNMILLQTIQGVLKVLDDATKRGKVIPTSSYVYLIVPYVFIGITNLLGHNFLSNYLWKPSTIKCKAGEKVFKIQGKDVCMSVAVKALCEAKKVLKPALRNARRRRASARKRRKRRKRKAVRGRRRAKRKRKRRKRRRQKSRRWTRRSRTRPT